jgi:molybdate transport system ATP-binding protein
MTASQLAARIVLTRADFTLDVDIVVEAGTTTALLGPNGAGKSSAIAAIAGLDLAGTLGEETLIGLGSRVLTDASNSVFVPPEARRIGVVFQDHRLFEHLSVLDNVAFALRSAGASRSESRRRAIPWIALLGLENFAARRPSELSGGQAQRVAIARALASDPDLLLLDEPLAALDVTTRSEVRRVLREQVESFAGPRLLVTHDPSDAFLLADRLYIVEDGRVTQSGSPDEIRRTPATPYVAALSGTNLFAGSASAGSVILTEHDHVLTIADTTLAGPVLVNVHPTAISLHIERPSGSQRNTWLATVDLVEPMGDTVRVTLSGPVPIAVDVTPGAVTSLNLVRGSAVWAAAKATELHASPA